MTRFPDHSLAVPQDDFRFIALDVETACGDSASICQIGLACVRPDDRIETFSMLVDPQMPFDAFNIRLHGIGPDQVAGAPTFPDALDMILPLIGRHLLVQHSPFDGRAISAACAQYGLPQPALRWSDSVTIARRAWPELRGNGGHGLANLKRVLDLQFHHHDAGEDARAAALVVLHAEARLALPFAQLALPVARKGLPKPVTRMPNPQGPLMGSVAVFTGNLSLPRDRAADLAASAGMEVRATVTRQTTHLIVGDQDLSLLAGHSKSSKHRKAEDMRAAGHPIHILGESAFLALLRIG